MIDYHPMTATEHRSLWAAATAVTWDYSTYPTGDLPEGVDRPGLHPEQIFDFHDGLRLIVSVDRYGDDKDHLHVSASARPDSQVYRRIKGGMVLERFTEIVKERVAYLSGRTVTLGYVTLPGKGVPHYFDPPLNEAAGRSA